MLLLRLWSPLLGSAAFRRGLPGHFVGQRCFAIATNCPDPSFPCHFTLHSANDGDERMLPPCIHHVIADHDCASLRELVMDEVTSSSSASASSSSSSSMLMTEEYLNELADFGAVYTAPSMDGKTRRLDDHSQLDAPAPQHCYVRVHQNPVRRRVALNVDWAPRMLQQAEAFVAVDKPTGIPMQAGVDNRVENLQHQLALHLSRTVSVTARLDICTGGCVVVATNRRATSLINKAQREGQVHKEYVALTRARVPVGRLDHCFKKGGKVHKHSKPTLLRAYDAQLLQSDPHWKLASLDVLSCTSLSPQDKGALPVGIYTGYEGDGEDAGAGELFEVRLRLLTGRTHQIRLQLAALAAPLVGDSRYAPVSGLLDEEGATHGDGTGLFGAQPDRIGLHCALLDYGSSCRELGLARVESPTPWWRR